MKLIQGIGLSALLTAALLGALQRPSSAHPKCRKLKGTLSSFFVTDGCTSPFGLCTQGTITGGRLAGTTTFVADAIVPGASPGSVSFSGAFIVTTSKGTVVFDTSGIGEQIGPFSQYNRAQSGTNHFAGATGTMFISGFNKPDFSGFDGTLSGQICVDDDDDDDDDD